MMLMGLYSLSRFPTIITNNMTTILDNFYTNYNTDIVSYSIIHYEITDNKPIYLKKYKYRKTHNNRHIIYKRSLTKIILRSL